MKNELTLDMIKKAIKLCKRNPHIEFVPDNEVGDKMIADRIKQAFERKK
jgi:hypothetical protein